jgi:hypothetical protein
MLACMLKLFIFMLMRATAIIVLLFLQLSCLAQSYKLSSPIDLPREGWNKLLLMHDGRTVLFHFENKKTPLIKVFDKKYNEIASEPCQSGLIDTKTLDNAYFDGVYDINGEAVLFLTQQIDKRESLLKLRFDAETAKLISEENITKTEGFSENTTAFLLKQQYEDGYNIVTFSKGSVTEASLDLKMYDEEHRLMKTIPVNMVKKGYDYIHLIGEDIDREGSILLTVELDKLIQYPDVIEKYLVLYFLPKGAEAFNAKIIKLPAGARDFKINFTDNIFANTVNIFLSSLQDKQVNTTLVTSLYHTLLIADTGMNNLEPVTLNDLALNRQFRQQSGTEKIYAGNILTAQTNAEGNTTVISEDIRAISGLDETDKSAPAVTYIAATQYDFQGKENWGVILPKAGYFKTALKHTNDEVFKTRTSEFELSQALSFTTKNNTYVIFNELDKNSDNNYSLIQDYNKTNAMYYKLSKKGTVTRSYLFDSPQGEEYKQAYTYSGDIDERKNLYATLMLSHKGAITSTHIAWCKLDK